MTTTLTVRDVSNMACIAMEFTCEADRVWQFNFLGNAVGFQVKPPGGKWSPMSRVAKPERFGELPGDEPTARNRKLARAWAEAFAAA